MKKFFYIVSNVAFILIGSLITSFSVSLREIITTTAFANNSIVAISCVLILAIGMSGVIILLTGIHGTIYNITGFSLYNYLYNLLVNKSKTDIN